MTTEKKLNWKEIAVNGLDILGDLAKLVILMRDKPRRLDWLAIGISSAALAHKAYDKWQSISEADPWMFFGGDEGGAEWAPLPRALGRLVEEYAMNKIETGNSNKDRNTVVVRAEICGEEVGWVAFRGQHNVISPIFYKKAQKQQFFASLGEAMWKRLDSNSVYFTKDGLLNDSLDIDNFKETAIIKRSKQYIRDYLKVDLTRGVLFHGPPGTGKTTMMRHIAQSLDLRSLRIKLDTLASIGSFPPSPNGTDNTVAGIHTTIQLLRPDIVIINDLDRLNDEVQGLLLEEIDELREVTKVVMVSMNFPDTADPALVRVGRFDKHFKVGGVEKELLIELLHDDELVIRMQNWPIIYILEFLKAKTAEGEEVAKSCLDELEERVRAEGQKKKEKIVQLAAG